MKTGARALGVAESFTGEESTLAGVVVRASRVVDGFAFERCTVGGTDATTAIVDLYERLDRDDVQYVIVAGLALAWYNVVDLHRLHDEIERPVLSVTFEESGGLEPAIAEAFDREAREERLATYRAQPARTQLLLGNETGTGDETELGDETGTGDESRMDNETVFVRAVGLTDDEAADVVRAFTPEGGRPEPVRVARLAARAANATIEDLL